MRRREKFALGAAIVSIALLATWQAVGRDPLRAVPEPREPGRAQGTPLRLEGSAAMQRTPVTVEEPPDASGEEDGPGVAGPPAEGRLSVTLEGIWADELQAREQAQGIRLVDPAGTVRHPEPEMQDDGLSSGTFYFDGIREGVAHGLEIELPGYEPWTRAGIRAGDHLTVELRGTARLLVSAVEAEHGTSIRDFRLVESSGMDLGSAWVREGVLGIEGLGPGLIWFVVRTDGYREEERSLTLRPGEVASIRVKLDRCVRIRGTVRQPDGAPAIETYVEATPHDAHVPTGALPPGYRFARLLVSNSITDDEGHYELCVPPGAYDIETNRRDPAVARQLVEVTASEVECDLVLPATHGRLEGRLVGSGAFDPRGWVVLARPAGAEVGGVGRDEAESGRPDPDGSFRLAGLGPGQVDLYLGLVADYGYDSSTPQSKWIARVEVGSTEEPVTLDVSEFTPGSVRLRVLRNQLPASQAFVSLCLPRPAALEALDPRVERSGASWAGFLDCEGTASIPAVFPGEYRIAVHAGRPLHFDCRETVHVSPGGVADVSIEIVDHRATLTVLDAATGAPAADSWIVFFPPDPLSDVPPPFHPSVTTDEAGRLDLVLPIGEYDVSAPELDLRSPWLVPVRRAAVRVRWTAHGPEPPTITLTVPPSPDLSEVLEAFGTDPRR